MRNPLKMTTPYNQRIEQACNVKTMIQVDEKVLQEMSKIPDTYMRPYADRLYGYVSACVGQEKAYGIVAGMFGQGTDYTALLPSQLRVVIARFAYCIPYLEPAKVNLTEFLVTKLRFEKKHARLVAKLAGYYKSAK